MTYRVCAMRQNSFGAAGLLLGLIVTAISSIAFAAGDATPAIPLYLKIPNPPTKLVVVDLGKDRMDGQIAACVLQGIVNRNGGEMIYVMNTSCADNRGAVQMGQRWLDEGLFNDIEKDIVKADEGANPGFASLLKRYKGSVKGLIVFDPKLEDATIEAATTIAGQTDGVVVSPAMVDELAGYGLPVLADLRENAFKDNVAVLKWLLEKWFAGANHELAFTWSHMTTDARSWGAANKDFVVAHKLFTFSLDINSETDRPHFAEVFSRYPQGTPVMGWVNETPYTYASIQDYGYFIVPYITTENLTVQSAFPSVKGTPITPKAAPIDEKAVYIAFFVADGDSLKHSMVHEPDAILANATFGTIPATWTINPGIVDLAPRVFTWYQKKMASAAAPQEMIGMMSDGSPRSDRFEAFKTFTAFTKHYQEQAGFIGLKQMDEGGMGAASMQPYVLNSGYSGSDTRGTPPYECHMVGNTLQIGSVVPGPRRQPGNIDNLRKVIREAPPGPLFLAVFCGTGSPAVRVIDSTAKALEADSAGRHPVYVRLSDLAATYRAWKGLPVVP